MALARLEQEGVPALEQTAVFFLEQMEGAANHVDEFPGIDDPGGVSTVAAGNKPTGDAGANPESLGSLEVHRRNRTVFMGKQCLVSTESV